jgi:hypothetical protein
MIGLVITCIIFILLICVWNIYLTLQLSKYKEMESTYIKLKNETEDVLYAFIEEWKEENEEFLNKLANNSHTYKEHLKEKNLDLQENPLSTYEYMEDEDSINYNELITYDQEGIQESISETLPTIPKQESSQVSDYQRILQLQKEGYMIDEIARALDKGKTEIELMLKLRT